MEENGADDVGSVDSKPHHETGYTEEVGESPSEEHNRDDLLESGGWEDAIAFHVGEEDTDEPNIGGGEEEEDYWLS